MSRRIGAGIIRGCRGRAALRNRSEGVLEAVGRGALAPPLVEALLFLFLADLDLSLIASSAGFIPAYSSLEKLRAL